MRAMKTIAALGLAGTLAMASATPSQARNGAAIAAGVGLGLLGAAIATNAYGYYGYPYYSRPYYPPYAYYGPSWRHRYYRPYADYGWRHRHFYGGPYAYYGGPVW